MIGDWGEIRDLRLHPGIAAVYAIFPYISKMDSDDELVGS